MRLGINAIGLFPSKIGGAEQYIRNIVSVLNKREDIEVYLFVNNEATSTFEGDDNLHIFTIDLSLDHGTQLNYYIEYYNIDIWFCPLFHLVPKNCKIPSIVAIFDIQQEFFPQYFDRNELRYRRKETDYTLKKATKILTISEFSKKTIIEKYGLPADKIVVTYLDADAAFDKEIDKVHLEEVKKTLPKEYIFYPANSWPHKNHMMLIKAYEILKNKYNTPLKLVFTGSGKQQKNNIDTYIKKHRLTNDIFYLGYQKQEDMPYIYAGASMLCFPSLFEGFGIPLVEAMKAGIPIACSECGSIPEVSREAALYFDAMDPKSIAEKMNEIYTNESTRIELVRKGDALKHEYSWDKCADETIQEIVKLYISKPIREKFEPLVSIITPSYNQGEFIRETIESVLNQDYQNIEYIVMDGGSTDNTVEILQEYGNRIKWVSEKDGGQADAVNKGLKVAKGTIIGWLNSDDTYCDGAVSTMVEYFRTHPDTDMVYGEGYYIDKDSNVTDRYLTEKYSYDRLAETCIICQPSAFFTKRIADKVGGLDKDLQLCMDYELWMKFAQAGNIAYISDYIANSRMYEENKTLSRRDEVYKEVCRTIKKYYGYVPHTWIYGYTCHLCNARSKLRKYYTFVKLYLKYNYNAGTYNYKFAKIIAKRFLYSRPHINSDGQKFIDGWLGKNYNTIIDVKQECKNLHVKGIHVLPFQSDLKVEVIIDEVRVAEFQLDEAGEFEKTISLCENVESGHHNITLNMNQTIQPKKAHLGHDPRQLSFQLCSLELR